MHLFVTSLIQGLNFALLSIGVFITFRVFRFPDMTTEGSFALGGSVAAALIVTGVDPLLATIAGGIAGSVAGILTGVIHTKFNVNILVAGIILTTALFSVNSHILGGPSLKLYSEVTLMTKADTIAESLFGMPAYEFLGASGVSSGNLVRLVLTLFTIGALVAALRWFFKTHLGLSLRAVGENDTMARPLGISVSTMIIVGLALANGFIAASGAVYAQAYGLAAYDDGIGMLVSGLAAVMLGKVIISSNKFGWGILGAVIGSIIYQLIVATILTVGNFERDIRLVTSLFLLAVLILPDIIKHLRAGTLGNFIKSYAGTRGS
ncbi:MAG: ABC transporter permease [Ectothiorhodospiraceae bacterium]|nr:ABC transporter permease [Ectothiorhodospiraceae bacterium]